MSLGPGKRARFPGALSLGILLILGGCYTFSGSTLPSHLKTIRIDPVQNRTFQSGVADRISEALVEGFRQRSNLVKVTGQADAELTGTLTRYAHVPQSTSGSRVTAFRVDLSMAVVFIDRVKGDTLYRADDVPGYGIYSTERGETEADGQRAAIAGMVRTILDNTVSGW